MRHGSAEQRDQAQHAAVRERGREPGPRRQGSVADTEDTAPRNLLIVMIEIILSDRITTAISSCPI